MPGAAVSALEKLEQRSGADWSHLRRARDRSKQQRTRVAEALDAMDSEDTSVVVSGSLARDEFTSGSDIDWTLLIDGIADPRHHDLYKSIDARMSPLAAKAPGQEGTFGAMVFSHDLIHEIGGEDDTNRNTTRRLLLLLESRPVRRDDAYRRVIRKILWRYLVEDRGLWRGTHFCVPRFLQNDFARYWRTLAVDFAYKLRKRSGRGWAIRNTKLRMSRKLIYVSGLLACYRCHLDFTPDRRAEVFRDASRPMEAVEHLEMLFGLAPLEITAGVLLRFPHLDGAARKILGSYDEFIGLLADPESRDRLEKLSESEADTDPVYRKARMLSHEFRDGLLEFFFDAESGMDVLTRNFGVF